MMAELHMAMNDAPALIQNILSNLESTQLAQAEQIVAQQFKTIFEKASDRAQIPLLTRENESALTGRIVRFVGMVQDSGFGPGTEIYNRISSKGELLLFGREDEAVQSDYGNLGERQAIFVINTPGKSDWTQSSAASDLSSSIANLSISSSDPSILSPFTDKFPIPTKPHFGTIAKIYDQTTIDSLRICGVYEFAGILGDTPLSTPFEDLMETAATPIDRSTVPALHVIFALPAPSLDLPVISTSTEENALLRNELIEYLKAGLGDDEDAAEWLLLAVLAKIHTRHPTGISLGQLSLNLSLPISSQPHKLYLEPVLSSLVEKISSLELSIPFLNDTATRMGPRNREENLESGCLQLTDGTVVLVDVRGVGEGKLFDTGVKNIQALTSTIATQKLAYQFPYSSFELESDLNYVLISEGKSFIPTSCVVPVEPKTESKFLSIEESKLTAFRSFIHTMKFADFSIPPEMSQIIQNDFVSRRQNSVGGEAMTQDDLLFRMTAARLLSLSHGKTALDEESWIKTGDLDERRKERLTGGANLSDSKPMKE